MSGNYKAVIEDWKCYEQNSKHVHKRTFFVRGRFMPRGAKETSSAVPSEKLVFDAAGNHHLEDSDGLSGIVLL
jgi:hypothetical protein